MDKLYKQNKTSHSLGDHMKGKIVEPSMELTNFEKAVNILASLIKSGDATISFAVGGVSVKGEKGKRQEAIAKHGLIEEDFDRIIPEILKITSIILSDSKKEEFEALKDAPEELQKLKDKVSIVGKRLDLGELTEKYQLQTTYKTNLLDKFDWEIITKCFEKEQGKLDPFPTAVLRFRIKRPFTDYPPIEKTETFVFECGKDEIESLISDMEEIKKYIERLENR